MSGERALLNSGYQMPLLGLGCWQAPNAEVAAAVERALDVGYRHIDTAYHYLNEEGVGIGLERWLRKTNKSRGDVFIVTKLPMIAMHPGGIEKFLRKSLENLRVDYVDLYLVHSPVGLTTKDDSDVFPHDEKGIAIIDESTDLIAVWKEMEAMVDLGLTKSIGLSNFNIRQMRKICANARIQPAVNQVEMHVQFQQIQLQEFCKPRNIVITAYSPLGSPKRPSFYEENSTRVVPQLLEHPVVVLIAENHKVSTAQILLRFLIQQDIVAIPKSVNPQRIKTNGEVWSFHLSETEMAALKSLDKGEDGRSFDVFPGFENHPECPW